jgi:hypothetical protein
MSLRITSYDAEKELRRRGICSRCHQNTSACVADAPDDIGRHEEYWRIMNVTARRPWWSASELLRILDGGKP